MIDSIWLIIFSFGIFLGATAKLRFLASLDSVLRQIFIG